MPKRASTTSQMLCGHMSWVKAKRGDPIIDEGTKSYHMQAWYVLPYKSILLTKSQWHSVTSKHAPCSWFCSQNWTIYYTLRGSSRLFLKQYSSTINRLVVKHNNQEPGYSLLLDHWHKISQAVTNNLNLAIWSQQDTRYVRRTEPSSGITWFFICWGRNCWDR